MIKFLTLEQRNAILLNAYGRLAKAFRWPTQVVPAFVRRANQLDDEAGDHRRRIGKTQPPRLAPTGRRRSS
jgi:hypothetical protein